MLLDGKFESQALEILVNHVLCVLCRFRINFLIRTKSAENFKLCGMFYLTTSLYHNISNCLYELITLTLYKHSTAHTC